MGLGPVWSGSGDLGVGLERQVGLGPVWSGDLGVGLERRVGLGSECGCGCLGQDTSAHLHHGTNLN